jgi:hypothetical protein
MKMPTLAVIVFGLAVIAGCAQSPGRIYTHTVYHSGMSANMMGTLVLDEGGCLALRLAGTGTTEPSLVLPKKDARFDGTTLTLFGREYRVGDEFSAAGGFTPLYSVKINVPTGCSPTGTVALISVLPPSR